MEHKEIKRTLQHAVNEELNWSTISLINDMLKEMDINAKFETEQQNTYFNNEDGEIIKLIIE